jgi:type VI secretion system protein ImpL
VIGESGLAGVNRQLEFKKAAWQIGVYAATLLIVVFGLIALSVSYANNRTYLDEVANDITALRRVRPAAAGASIEAFLPYLNAVRAVSDSANRYRDDRPFGMRWGLFQGSSVGNAARDAYQRELDSIVLPRFAVRVRQRLGQYAADPEKLYAYLKAYLMLADPKHLDKKHLQFLADLEWARPDAPAGSTPSPATHFASFLEYGDSVRPIGLDPLLVQQARTSIREASIPQIMYGQLKRAYSSDTAGALRLDVIAGVGIEKVLRRKSGKRLSEPIPSIYTKKTFNELTGGGMLPLVKQFSDEAWVWGAGGPSAASWGTLTTQVSDVYERDYNKYWDDLLGDLQVAAFPTVQQYADALGIFTGPTSPLRGILKTVVEHTTLVATADSAAAGPPPSLPTRLADSARGIFDKGREMIVGGAKPGTMVTQRFAPIHRLMAGAPSPFDGILEQVRKIRDQLLRLGPQAGGETSLKALTDPQLNDLLRTLQTDASNLPSPVNGLVAEIAGNAVGAVSRVATGELDKFYQNDIVARCRQLVADHYPFGNATEMTLGAFGEAFGYGGLFDKFFTERLEQLVDRSQARWAWRAGSVDASRSQAMLDQFERVERIRQMFFNPGSKTPELNFSLKLSNVDPSATRFYVNIDGQQFEARPGSESRTPAVWPGPDKRGSGIAVFEDRMAAPDRVGQYGGSWGWFHLIDATIARAPTELDTDLETVLRIESKFHKATVTIEASSGATNPFASHDWRQFRCER